MKGTKILATILLFVVLYALFALALMFFWNLTFHNLMGATEMPYATALGLAGLCWICKFTFLV